MNLTPEKRMDKNGRLVTRHVRGSNRNTLSISVPAPQVSEVDASHITQTRVRLAELLKESIEWVPTSERYAMERERWEQAVPTMPSKAMTTAHEILSRHYEYRSVRRAVSSILSNLSLYDDMDELCMHLKFAAVEKYYDDSIKMFDHTRVRSVCLSHVLALTNQDIYDDKPDELQVQKAVAVAHVVVAASLKDSDVTSRYADFKSDIADYPELVQLAVSHSERGEDIADLILERGSDAGLVQDFLASETVLNSGIL